MPSPTKGIQMRLTDTQLIILGEASSRDDGIVILPERLKGGAATKVIEKLLKAKLVDEIPASAKLPAWRRDETEGTAFALRITAAGLKAISAGEEGTAEPSAPPPAEVSRTRTKGKSAAARPKKQVVGGSPKRRFPNADSTAERRGRSSGTSAARSATHGQAARSSNHANDATVGTAPRQGSKIASVIVMLRRAKGASIQEIMSTTGWLPHTTRAALTGLRKRGLKVERAKEARGKETVTVYRIEGA
jgi:hypothetical protein